MNTKSASEAQSLLRRLPAVRERAAAAQYERGQERPVQRPVLRVILTVTTLFLLWGSLIQVVILNPPPLDKLF
ncbi:hypothetical protein NDU88_008339 [Pleurodeles waltl]|uniref:Stress-associated endoplasmic reticulum protein n=1 Tax=Pleurodeles waltl TaxID=8319 RepID=A0AAV7QN88_PLEWA|nr:hypothetical protein NDU88_008339 [Pleurodeles waltl]